MIRSSLRFGSAAILAALLPACSGGGAGLTPGHRSSNAARTTQATFAIKWTNAAAPASVRHKDTISPSAQSVVVTINGSPGGLVNRNGSPSQSITLAAPIGTDQFLFTVYDQPSGLGHLLGSATVIQQIVDGAANVVTAVIQAVCTVTNVSYVAGSDPVVWTVYGASGIYAQTLQSIVLAGQAPATLTIEPEDVDGNVIISGTGGTVPNTITGSATVTQINGTSISLTPKSGARSTTPDTLTVAASGCPSTTVGVQHSPAIFIQGSLGVVTIDWYGDVIGQGYPVAGDVLIGYDTQSQRLISYNKGTGQVNAYGIPIGAPTPLYPLPLGSTVTWSNAIDGVFVAQPSAGTTINFTYSQTSGFQTGPTTPGTPVAAAAPVTTYLPRAFTTNGSTLYAFALPAVTLSATMAAAYPVSSLATLDPYQELDTFDSSGSNIAVYSQSLSTLYSNGPFGLSSAPAVGALDADAYNIYTILANGFFMAVTQSGTNLNIYNTDMGTPEAVVVISTNSF